MRAILAWSLMMLLVMVSAAFGQTASDLGEGLRAELTNTSGVTAIKWWGKAGRTYFVQSSETLLPDSWQYMPVVEAGTNAVHTWNLQTSAERMFVRLVYTDQLYSGAAGDADFDGDGLTNALEVSITGPNTNPFLADTDWDGFGDGAEVTAGSNEFLIELRLRLHGFGAAQSRRSLPPWHPAETQLEMDVGGLHGLLGAARHRGRPPHLCRSLHHARGLCVWPPARLHRG